MDRVSQAVKELVEEIQRMPEAPDPAETDRHAFTLLLNGIAACRRAPGIPSHMGYRTLYRCGDEPASEELKAHLFRLYGIYDRESLEKVCMEQFTSGREYEQFMTFWCDAPLFDLEELEEKGRRAFETRFKRASLFRPYVGERGFYAWDINERIGLGRLACACGIIDRETFDELTDYQVRKAQVFYHTFKDYAVSCICGAVYDVPGGDEEDMLSFLDLNRKLALHLLEEGGAWYRNAWYTPEKREWVSLLPHNGGCIVSKQIEEGRAIGYMYRDSRPSEQWADTGWRFFAGDESDEYSRNPDNFTIWSLNDICNLDATILGYAEAKEGSAFGRNAKGEWQRER